uniref:Uncharacterized protein n=1 Tax=Eptatretus burgeri TaxID=7764 RepID=A0A8C4R6M7_EPTBU
MCVVGYTYFHVAPLRHASTTCMKCKERRAVVVIRVNDPFCRYVLLAVKSNGHWV